MSQGAIPRQGGSPSSRVAVWPRPEGAGPGRDSGLVERLAGLAGEGHRVLVVGHRAEVVVRGLRGRGCQVVDDGPADPASLAEPAPERFEVALAADLLGRVADPGATLRAIRDRLGPGGSLVATIADVESAGDGDELALGAGEAQPAGPLGPGSRVVFRLDGLLDLLEDSGFAVGHLEESGPSLAPGASGGPTRDLVIVAHPLTAPGFDLLRRRMRAQAEGRRDAEREADEARRCLEAADRRLEILTRHQAEASDRIRDLRAKLLDVHQQLLHRDDEIRATFGGALHERAALLAERDALTAERDALSTDRDRLAGLAADREVLAARRDRLEAERLALADHRDALIGRVEILRAELENARELGRRGVFDLEERLGACAAERDALSARLDRFRRSVPGRAYLAARRIIRAVRG